MLNENWQYIVNTSLIEYYNNKTAREIRKKMIFSNDKEAYCQYCSFRRGDTLLNYLFPIVKKDKTDKYGHKLRRQRNNDENIKQKLVRFNEIFKDGEEDKWLDALENLRQEYYAGKDKDAQIRS